MTIPAILSVATGVPEARYPQADIAEYFITLQRHESRRARAIRSIFERSGVGYRHFVVGEDYFVHDRTTEERNDRYMQEAIPLSEATIKRGLEASGCRAEDVDDLIVVSCTGIAVPGLDLHLAARLGMRHDLQRACVLGMGCYGAFPGLLRARQAAASQSGRLALMLSVELCSLHMQFDDATETVVSSALFADGASMALVGVPAEAPDTPQPRILHSATHCDYTTFEHMSFHLTNNGFRMSLSSYVPDLLRAQIEPFVDAMLTRCGLTRGDVRHWGIHPGGSTIIEYVGAQLGLSAEQVDASYQVLHDYGNMSSATILFVLDRIHRCQQPSPGDYGVLLAFGPGLTMEGVVLQW